MFFKLAGRIDLIRYRGRINLRTLFILFFVFVFFISFSGDNIDGFFHDKKPPPPQVGSANPNIQAVFDELYYKHPNINQEDIDQAHIKLSTDCATHDNNEEIEMMSFFCTAMSNGLIKGYLENLGYTFYEESEPGQAPRLIL